MLGKTNITFKILGWCVVALTLLLVINYFIYDVSLAADNKTISDSKFENGIATFDKWDEIIELGAGDHKKTSEKLSSKLVYADSQNSYQISNIQLTISGNKITLHYNSNYKYLGKWYNAASHNDYNNAKYKYKFSITFVDPKYPDPESMYKKKTTNVLTEWRRDGRSGTGDHETYNFCGDDFNLDVPSMVFYEYGTSVNTKTIEQLIADGLITIRLEEVQMNTH